MSRFQKCAPASRPRNKTVLCDRKAWEEWRDMKNCRGRVTRVSDKKNQRGGHGLVNSVTTNTENHVGCGSEQLAQKARVMTSRGDEPLGNAPWTWFAWTLLGTKNKTETSFQWERERKDGCSDRKVLTMFATWHLASVGLFRSSYCVWSQRTLQHQQIDVSLHGRKIPKRETFY